MRKRINNSKDSSSSRPSGDGQKSFRRPSAKTRPEAESRFSKPSIKKSSLRAASTGSGSSDKQGSYKPRSFDKDSKSAREYKPGDRPFDKSGSDKPSYDKPRFDRPRFDKPGIGKPRFSDRDKDSREFKPRENSERSVQDRPGSDRPRFDKPDYNKPRSSDRDGDSRGFKPRESNSSGFDRPRPERDGEGRSFKPRGEFNPREKIRDEKPRFERQSSDKPTYGNSKPSDSPREEREFKPRGEFNPRERSGRGESSDRPRSDRPVSDRSSGFDKPGFAKPRTFGRDGDSRDAMPKSDRPFGDRSQGAKPAFKKKDESEQVDDNTFQDVQTVDEGANRRVGKFETAPHYKLGTYEKKAGIKKKKTENQEMRLNRYIANAGICSRREADDLIAGGQISVNGKVVTEMGHKVVPSDVVKFGKKALNPEKLVYVLINKPKDYITTTDDPEERKTVLDLVKGACFERIYPVGRLDRNTTGLLLMTNDGELAEKLTHPSGGVKKIYQAELDRAITNDDFEKLQHGLELEDGFIRPDEVGIVTADAMVVGLEIHSGRNRIVRRMFEHLGYEVQKLDRTVFAGLDKKDLPRGKWRFLSEKEVIRLKYML